MDNTLAPLRVFVVEDSPIILELLVRAVHAGGAQLVGHSDNAKDAAAALLAVQPDLVIIDIKLKAGNGFDVLQALQATGHTHSAIKMVFTNYASPEYRDLGLQLGANAFFDKALEGSQALDFVYRLAARRRNRGNHSPGLERRRTNRPLGPRMGNRD